MKLLILVAAAMLLAACATKPQGEEVADDARIFRTGSHLPVRDNQVQSVQSTQGKIINTQAPINIPTKPSN
jgi:starvation-inducible outer membrane lipoprotein